MAREDNDDVVSESTPFLSHSINQVDITRDRSSVWYTSCSCWPKLVTTELVLIIYSLYLAAAWPLTEQYIYAEVSNRNNFTDEVKQALNCSFTNKSSPEFQLKQFVQSQATSYMIYQNVALLFPSFFVTIFLGGYSDKAGRKFAMIYPCIGALIRCIFCIIIIQLNLSLTWFFVASVMEGCFGGSAMFLMAAFSYITDITTEKNRSFRIVLLESCLGLGIASSQLALGYVIKSLGYMWPFVILGSLAFLDIIYITFCVPETVIPLDPVPLLRKEHILGTFHLYFKDDGKSRRWKLWVTLAIVFFCGLPELGSADTKNYHLFDTPLCWDSVLLGKFGAYSYAVIRLGGVLAAKFLQQYIGDIGLVMLGAIFGCNYYGLFSVATSTTVVFLGE